MSPNDPLIGWSNRPKQAELDWNTLQESRVLAALVMNHPLLIKTREGEIKNIGRLIYARIEGNNGVAFVIATDLMPKGGMLYVEMAEELR